MRTTRFVASLVALMVVIAACSPAAPTFESEFEGVTGIVLNTTEGSVTIDGDDRTTTLVTGDASFSDAEQFDVRVEDGILIVEHDCGSETSCSVEYRLTIPEGIGIEVTTTDANVQVSDVSAGVAVTTTDGDVFVRRIEGDIVVSTSTGRITGTQNRSEKAGFRAAEESEISVSFDTVINSLVAETEKGDVSAQLDGGPYDLEVETGSGSVDIKVDVDPNSPNQASLRTGAGDITVFQN